MPAPAGRAEGAAGMTAVVLQMKPAKPGREAAARAARSSRSAKPDRWMPLHIGDYLADTTDLTTTEHGAYLLLLMAHWRHGSVPDDEAKLARIAKLRLDHWRKIAGTVLAFFRPGDEPGTLVQKRLRKELERASGVAAKRADAARQRWEREADQGGVEGGNPPATPGGLGGGDSGGNSLKSQDGADANARVLHMPGMVQVQTQQVQEDPVSPDGDTAPRSGAAPGSPFPADFEEPEALDPKRLLWREGRHILRTLGVADANTPKGKEQAGKLIGAWLSDLRDDHTALLHILRDAEAARPVGSAKNWLCGAVLARKRTMEGRPPKRAAGVADAPSSRDPVQAELARRNAERAAKAAGASGIPPATGPVFDGEAEEASA